MIRWLTTSRGTMTDWVSREAVPPATKLEAAAAPASVLVIWVMVLLLAAFTLSSVVRYICSASSCQGHGKTLGVETHAKQVHDEEQPEILSVGWSRQDVAWGGWLVLLTSFKLSSMHGHGQATCRCSRLAGASVHHEQVIAITSENLRVACTLAMQVWPKFHTGAQTEA